MAAKAEVMIADSGKMEKLLQQWPIMLRRKIVNRALPDAAKPVVQEAQLLCPASYVTGTRKLWSKKTRTERAGVKPLVDTMTYVIRDYDEVFVCVVGPAYPAGALGHLVEFSRRKILWGRDSGMEIQGKPFLRPAADKTRPEQRAAMLAALEMH